MKEIYQLNWLVDTSHKLKPESYYHEGIDIRLDGSYAGGYTYEMSHRFTANNNQEAKEYIKKFIKNCSDNIDVYTLYRHELIETEEKA